MYMVVKGLVRLSAETLPEFAKQSWTDGAFFGEVRFYCLPTPWHCARRGEVSCCYACESV